MVLLLMFNQKEEKLMWGWKDLTPFGQGVVAGIVLGFLILMMVG